MVFSSTMDIRSSDNKFGWRLLDQYNKCSKRIKGEYVMAEKSVAEALKKIKDAENDLIRLETQSDTALKTLEEKYEINSIAKGDTYLDGKGKELDKLEADLATKKKALEDNFPWE